MSQQRPVTRVQLDTPITTADTIKLPESGIKQKNVLSYPFVKNSPIHEKGKASGSNQKKYLIYAFICIVGLAALMYTYQDRIKSLFDAKGNQANAQATKKSKNGNRTTALVASESSDEGEDDDDPLDIDEDILPSAKSKTKTRKQKNTTDTNDIYFTPI